MNSYHLLPERQSDATNSFLVPPSNAGALPKDYSHNPSYELGSNLTLIWSSNYTTIFLDFTQDLSPCVPGVTPCGLTSTYFSSPTDPGRYDWVVDPKPYNIAASNVFYFVMYNRSQASTASTFTSHYFNITEPQPSSSSSSASGTSTASSTSAPAQASSTSPTQPPSTPPAGLSSGAKAGIAVGLVAVALMLIGAIWMFLRRRKETEVRAPSVYYEKAELPHEDRKVYEVPHEAPKYEKNDGKESRFELSGEEIRMA